MADQFNTAPIPPAVAQELSQTVPMPNAYANTQQAPQQYTPQPQYQQQAAYAPVTPMAPVAPKKKSKLPIIIAILGIIVIAFVALTTLRDFLPTSPSSTPTDTVEKAAEAALDLDFDKTLNSIPPQLIDYALQRGGYSDRAELVEYLNSQVKNLEDSTQAFGIDARSLLKLIDVKTSDVSYYSEDGLASLKNEWNNRIPGFGDSFEDAATVKVEISGQLDILGQSFSLSDYLGVAPQNVTAVQIDGQWYVLDSGDLMSIGDYL